MQEDGRLGRQDLFRLVQLLALQLSETSDLVERKFGEQLEQAADVAIFAVAPELPVIVGAHRVRVEPDRAGLGLAHLAARGGRQQRRGQREQLSIEQPAAEVDAVDDVAPLVRSAHLQNAAVAFVKLHEIVGLQDHVVEFEKRQRLLALQAQLHRVERQHLVDGEMAADVAQEGNIVQPVEPLGVVRHHGAGVKIEKARKYRADRGDVGLDLRACQQRAARVLARWIADLAGTAAHQRDRAMAGLLQPSQHHDREQVADVEARRGGVEADIGGEGARGRLGIEALGVRNLVDESAFREDAQEIGLVGAHAASPLFIASFGPVV